MARKHGSGTQKQRQRGTVYKEEGQEYARVRKMLGDMRAELEILRNEPLVSGEEEIRVGVIRGNMRKRVWVNRSDLVLVTFRESLSTCDTGVVDIIHKYEHAEERRLPDLRKSKTSIWDDGEGSDDDCFAFDEDFDVSNV